jgi:hypothetical protein
MPPARRMNRVILANKIVVSAVIALGLAWWLERGIGSHPKYTQVQNDIAALRNLLDMKSLEARCSSAVDPELEKSISRVIDPWGRPYRYTEVTTAAARTPDFRIYSMGKDGQSASGGDDPDDINSWDKHHVAYYEHVPFWRYPVIFIVIQLVIGVPVFLVIHFVHVMARSVFCRSAEAKVT